MLEKLHLLQGFATNDSARINYYYTLASNPDEYLAAGGLCTIFEMKRFDIRAKNLLNNLRHIPCVFHYSVSELMKYQDFSLVDDYVQEPAQPFDYSQEEHAIAVSDQNYSRMAFFETQLFLLNGKTQHLVNAFEYQLNVGDIDEALSWIIRALLIDPDNKNHLNLLLNTLINSKYRSELRSLLNNLLSWNLHPLIVKVYLAEELFSSDQLAEFSKTIKSIPIKKCHQVMQRRLYALLAKESEKSGDYTKAHNFYKKMNNPEKLDYQPGKKAFINDINAMNNITVEAYEPQQKDNLIMMLGFPRSGTTLLENALDSHPAIEAFEELPTFDAMKMAVFNHCAEKKSGNVDSQILNSAIDLYFNNIERYSQNDNTSVYIDKYPIRTAYAGMLRKALPNQKYIFSIRHPYDVVISCFKQNFQINPAMSHFTDFDDACNLYDFVMTQWFNHFTEEDNNICYVRYENLVEDFHNEVTRILGFLHLQWDDEIMSFSENAEKRSQKTPSYEKVKKGLSLGVQSSWKNYQFLFEREGARKLDKWLNKFGYEGL